MDKSLVARFEVKEHDSDSRTFSGLAATYDRDLGGDVIMPGAFKRTLRMWKKSKSPLPLLDSHNAFSTVRAVVGKMTEAEETDAGLDATFEVIDGPDGDEIFRRVKGDYVDGLSIGYKAVQVKYPDSEAELAEGIFRYLKEVQLKEVSVVLFPMNTGARITTKSMMSILLEAEECTSNIKAMLLSMGEDDEIEKDDIVELQRIHDHVGKLLEAAEKEEAQEGLTPEKIGELQERISLVMATQLGTRIDEVRHAAKLLQL